MILRKTYNMTDWKNWDHQLDSSAKEFFTITGQWPNILLANDPTLGRIDFLANQARENIVCKPASEKIDDQDTDVWREIYGFQGKSYSIEFCIDSSLENETFSLIFDSNPNGDGGEPIPEIDNVIVQARKFRRLRKAA